MYIVVFEIALKDSVLIELHKRIFQRSQDAKKSRFFFRKYKEIIFNSAKTLVHTWL